MAKKKPESLNASAAAFIAAKFIQSRLIDEDSRTSLSAQSIPNDSSQVQIKFNSSSTFSVSLDNVQEPKHFVINIEFKGSVVGEGTDTELMTYYSKYQGAFAILSAFGVSDWSNIPGKALLPYFSFLYGIAGRRAESTLSAMGVRGIVVPPADINI